MNEFPSKKVKEWTKKINDEIMKDCHVHMLPDRLKKHLDKYNLSREQQSELICKLFWFVWIRQVIYYVFGSNEAEAAGFRRRFNFGIFPHVFWEFIRLFRFYSISVMQSNS